MNNFLKILAFIVGAVVSLFLVIFTAKDMVKTAEDRVKSKMDINGIPRSRISYDALVAVEHQKLVNASVDEVMSTWKKRFGVKK